VIERQHIIRTAWLAAILTFTVTAPLFAQIPGFGVKGGVNLATQQTSGEDAGDDGLETFPAAVAGVFMTFPVASWLDLQPEVLYSVKGSRFAESGFSGTALIDYLEVPLLARVSRRGSGRMGFYAAGGPYAAFKMRARTRVKFGGSTEEMDIGEDVESTDFGLSIGGGIEFGSFVFDGRYSHGLKDVDKDRSDRIQVTNRAVAVTAGFKF
jgi:Outer membrane protein beta-barrel domain